jgi:prevent-host-death family protein
MSEIKASEFKARCLALIDEVAATGRPLTVTKRGRPLARLVPVEEPASLRGSVAYRVDEEALLAPVEAGWSATGG